MDENADAIAKPSSSLLQRTGGDHRGGRAQLGRGTFMMTFAGAWDIRGQRSGAKSATLETGVFAQRYALVQRCMLYCWIVTPVPPLYVPMVWYDMVNVNLYSAIITKVSNELNTLVSGEKPGARFTNNLTIYRKIIVSLS